MRFSLLNFSPEVCSFKVLGTDPVRSPYYSREVMSTFDFSSNDGATEGSKETKRLLNLGLGDPSVYGNFPPPLEAIAAIEKSLHSRMADGYPESIGFGIAREAVANYFNEEEWIVTKDDVVMCHGASGALDMAITVLADSTKNVLLPRPLFTAYETMTATTQASIRYYNLLPHSNWEVDLEHLDSLIDENSAFIMLNK